MKKISKTLFSALLIGGLVSTASSVSALGSSPEGCVGGDLYTTTIVRLPGEDGIFGPWVDYWITTVEEDSPMCKREAMR